MTKALESPRANVGKALFWIWMVVTLALVSHYGVFLLHPALQERPL